MSRSHTSRRPSTVTAPDPHELSTDGRRETPVERLDRNWGEILQELRVTQTGIQILTGFLLTIPFSQRFTDLDQLERTVFLVTAASSILSAGLIIAPVAFHRVLFRQQEKEAVVAFADRALLVGLVLLLVGIALTDGLLAGVGATEIVVAALVLFVVRPLAAGLALAGSCGSRTERATMAFFGVRGIGSVYYAARAGLSLMAVTMTGVMFVIFGQVVGRTAAFVSAGLTFATLTTLWLVIPLIGGEHDSTDHHQDGGDRPA